MLFALDGLFEIKVRACECVLAMACSSSRINTAEDLCWGWVFANIALTKSKFIDTLHKIQVPTHKD